MDEKSCYSCVHCTSEPNEFATWCCQTGKTIDDGFGEGDCIVCNMFIPYRSLIYSGSYDNTEALPF